MVLILKLVGMFFFAIGISKLLYSILAWYGFCKNNQIVRLKKVLKHAVCLGFLQHDDSGLEEMVDCRSKALFGKIIMNPNHILAPLLPPAKLVKYELWQNGHGLVLPPLHSPFDLRNFLLNMLYKHP